MSPEEFSTIVVFEGERDPGDTVRVRWTAPGQRLTARARIVQVNRASVKVALLEAVDPYPVGSEIRVPLFAMNSGLHNWSPHNRIEPVDGYHVVS
jgi:hypothetical protein